jgi:hypothetical protein
MAPPVERGVEIDVISGLSEKSEILRAPFRQTM